MHYLLYLHLIEIVLIFQLFNGTNAEALQGSNISPANPNEFPFIASLATKPRSSLEPRVHFCTGVLISKKHILTAEHCLEDKDPSEFEVIVGETDLRKASLIFDVDFWTIFSEWAVTNGKPIENPINDITIISLLKTVNRQDVVPVTLTHLNAVQLQGRSAIMAGWGDTNKGKLANVLQKVKVRILTTQESNKKLKLIAKLNLHVSKNYLATAADPYALAGCGDSGSPLLDENNHLLGITRGRCPTGVYWGPLSEKFYNENQINLHSSVDYYRDFIVDTAEISSNVESNDV